MVFFSKNQINHIIIFKIWTNKSFFLWKIVLVLQLSVDRFIFQQNRWTNTSTWIQAGQRTYQNTKWNKKGASTSWKSIVTSRGRKATGIHKQHRSTTLHPATPQPPHCQRMYQPHWRARTQRNPTHRLRAAPKMGNWVIGNWKLIESTTITNYIW